MSLHVQVQFFRINFLPDKKEYVHELHVNGRRRANLCENNKKDPERGNACSKGTWRKITLRKCWSEKEIWKKETVRKIPKIN